jgi:hypothetical protein
MIQGSLDEIEMTKDFFNDMLQQEVLKHVMWRGKELDRPVQDIQVIEEKVQSSPESR